MSYPLLQFVDSVDPDAILRLDLNDGATFRLPPLSDLNLGAPSYSGSPSSVGASYGFRSLTLPTLVVSLSSDGDVAREAYGRLAREVVRPWNILRWQLDQDSEPVFFRTYRSEPAELEYVHAQQGVWRASQTLSADPWAYGLPVVGTATISNDPSDTGGLVYRLGAAKGDLPSPLQLTSDVQDWRGHRLMVASQALSEGTQTSVPVVDSAAMDDVTGGVYAGVDAWEGSTATATGSVEMSAGTYTRLTPSDFDLNTWKSVLSCDIGSLEVGEYRLMLRVRSSDATTTWKVRAAQVDDVGSQYALRTGRSVDYSGRVTVGPHWLDLGVFRFPFGAPPPSHGLVVLPDPQAGQVVFQVLATDSDQRFDFDCAVLVPAGLDAAVDTETSWTQVEKSLTATTCQLVLDGTSGDVRYLLDGVTGDYAPGFAPDPEGALPVVVPGADNSLFVISHVGTGYNDVRTGTVVGTNSDLVDTTFDWSFFPRYVWERPSGG